MTQSKNFEFESFDNYQIKLLNEHKALEHQSW